MKLSKFEGNFVFFIRKLSFQILKNFYLDIYPNTKFHVYKNINLFVRRYENIQFIKNGLIQKFQEHPKHTIPKTNFQHHFNHINI